MRSCLFALAAGLVACSEPRHPTTDKDTVSVSSNGVNSAEDTNPSVSAEPSAPPTVSVPPDYVGARAFSAPAMPAKLVIDGKLDEWSFDKGTNAFVAVDGVRVVLAIAWDAVPTSGISIALAARSKPFPRIGWVQRGGYTHALTDETCEFQQIPFIEAGWDNGARNPPEVAAACKKLLARHAKLGAEYRDRFVRRYRLTTTAIESLDVQNPAWMSEVKLASSAKGIEVELPIAALPELAEAPLTKLFVASADGDLPSGLMAPEAPGYETTAKKEGWEDLTLEKPAGFGTLAPVLALVFPVDAADAADMFQLFASSYHPSSPTTVRQIGVRDVKAKPLAPAPKRDGVIGPPTSPDRPMAHESESPLFTTWKNHGDLELGFSSDSNLVILRNGTFVSSDSLGKPDGSRIFEKDLHLFEYSPPSYTQMFGWQYPRWDAVSVKPDGTIVRDLALPNERTFDTWDDTAKPLNDKEWSTFGIQGKVDGKTTKVMWTWSPSAGAYEPSR